MNDDPTCMLCGGRIKFLEVDGPGGSGWAHEHRPVNGHDAVPLFEVGPASFKEEEQR